jgi:hypothetical protein
MVPGCPEVGGRYKYSFISFWKVFVLMLPSISIVIVKLGKLTESASGSTSHCYRFPSGPKPSITLLMSVMLVSSSTIRNESSMRRMHVWSFSVFISCVSSW